MKEIYIYSTLDAWLDEKPDATIKGDIKNKTAEVIEIYDENGYTQILNMDKLFAVVY